MFPILLEVAETTRIEAFWKILERFIRLFSEESSFCLPKVAALLVRRILKEAEVPRELCPEKEEEKDEKVLKSLFDSLFEAFSEAR